MAYQAGVYLRFSLRQEVTGSVFFVIFVTFLLFCYRLLWHGYEVVFLSDILPAIQMKKNGFGSYFSSFIGPEQVRKLLSSIVIKKKNSDLTHTRQVTHI